MAKAQGLVGNFNGKVGNMVGFKVCQSNNGTNQGVRIYQPVRRNPKTVAQAQQRAKYAPIFATYRALKSIIDRGQESLPYGNASRIAWLKKAFRSKLIPWTPQGSTVEYPVGCQLTQGSLNEIYFTIQADVIYIPVNGVISSDDCYTIAELSNYLISQYDFLKEGDQVTLIVAELPSQSLQFRVISYILDKSDESEIKHWGCDKDKISFEADDTIVAAAIIVSREGAHGEHLRSTSILTINGDLRLQAPYNATSKTVAVRSYMASDNTNDDWYEEPI